MNNTPPSAFLGGSIGGGYSSGGSLGNKIVTSEAFIRVGEFVGASQLNAALTGYDFRGQEFSGFGRVGQLGLFLTSSPVSPGKIGGITTQRGAIEQINPRNLIPTQTRRDMSGSQVERLTKDMKINGFDQTKPVTAERNGLGRLEVVDGHHRTEAAKRAGINKIPVKILE